MGKELKVAAKNTHWLHFGIRSLCHPNDFEAENSIEFAIYKESLMLACGVRNVVADELNSDGYGLSLLNHSPEYIMEKYSIEYPELCLILFHLSLFGPLSPLGVASDWILRHDIDYIFGASRNSPLHCANFYRKCIPVIRITSNVFTLGTNQPQFSTVNDVKNYYRDDARIDEIAELCMFWIRKFYM